MSVDLNDIFVPSVSLEHTNVLLDPILYFQVTMQDDIQPIFLISLKILRQRASQLSNQQNGLIEQVLFLTITTSV